MEKKIIKEEKQLTEAELKNIEEQKKATLNNIIMPIRSKLNWQGYSIWRVTIMWNSLVVLYLGLNGGVIYCNKKSLETTMNCLENDRKINKEGKQSYQLQQVNENYISRIHSNIVSEDKERSISFKFLRVSFKTGNCLLYQNYFELNSDLTIGKYLRRTLINLSIEQFLNPLNHISTPSLNSNVTDSDNVYEDIDID